MKNRETAAVASHARQTAGETSGTSCPTGRYGRKTAEKEYRPDCGGPAQQGSLAPADRRRQRLGGWKRQRSRLAAKFVVVEFVEPHTQLPVVADNGTQLVQTGGVFRFGS